jgi:surface polysaccharide O-acyltransferase-like enzyme
LTNQQGYFWVHLIRAFAVMCVLMLHAAAQVLQLDVVFSSNDWWIGNIINSAMRMCVPLLFMITGFLLLGKSELLEVFFRKRLSKIAIPIVVWSLIYIGWLLLVEVNNPSPISPTSEQVTEFISALFPFSLVGIFFAPAYYHLWFMYALIGLYLCLPLLRILVQNAERKMLWYMVILWSFATFVIPAMQSANMYILIELNMLSGNIGYLVLGYLLGTTQISKRLFMSMWSLFIISVAITAIGTWWISTPENLNQLFYGSTPNVLTMSISSFIILRYLGEKWGESLTSKLKDLVLQLSACAFGIYLIHALFLYSFHKGLLGFTLDSIQGNALIYIPLTAVVVYLSSFFVIYIVRKIPYLRAIAP